MALTESEELELLELEEQEALSKTKSSQKKEFSYSVPPTIRKIGQVITTPIRGFRGMGVGAEKLLQDISPQFMIPGGAPSLADVSTIVKNAPMALQRAAVATKPGYEPIPGERLGANLGEALGYAGLTAPLAAIAPASIPIQAAIGAGTGGALSAISDISEQGKIYPKRIATNAAIGAALPLLSSESLKSGAAKTMGALGRIQSGVEQKAGERLYKDPGAFYSPSEAAAGEKLGSFRAEKGLRKIPQTAKEIVSPEAGEARKYVVGIEKQYALSKLGRAEQPTASQLLKAKQSLNKIIEVTPFKQKQTRADLFELKNSVSDALEKMASGEKSASAEYARSALASKFRKLFPVTKSGDISILRTVGLPVMEPGSIKDLGMIGSVPIIAAQSPALSGAAISTAGGVHQAAQLILKNPVTKQVVQSELQQVIKTLSRDKAKEFLKEAKGDKDKARLLAIEAGYTIPKKKK